MKVRSIVVIGGVIVLGMLAVSAWAWPQIPANAQIPIHWGPDGQVDGYGPKWVGLLGLPAVALAVVGLLAVIPRFEPRRANLERSSTAYVAIALTVVGFFAVLHLVAVMAALGSDINTTTIALAGTGVLFVVMGNFMGKTRSNWFFGIRTPWTLSSDRSWTQTHRLGGWLFVAIGIGVLIATLALGPVVALWIMVGGLAVSVIGLFAYSYVVWRDDPARQTGVSR